MKRALLTIAVAALFIAATVPPFKARNLDNEWVELKDLMGKQVTLISFWATWCKPCLEELKAVEKLFQKYKDEGFAVIAVNTDGPKTQSKVRPVVTGNRLSFAVVLDPTGDLTRLYKVRAWPTSFLVDCQGNIISNRLGYNPGDERELEQELLKLLVPEEQSKDR